MFQRVCLVSFFLMLTVVGALAQILLQFPIEPPERIVRDSLDTPFARVLMAEFARSTVRNADPACLQSKGLDEAKLAERGRDLFRRWGTTSMETITRVLDVNKFEEKIAERAGRGAVAEMARLQNDPVVKQYMVIERPLRLVKVLGFVIEQFDRYVLLNKIKLDSISPISNGKDELLRADPTEEIEEALDKFVTESRSSPFKRFYELSEIAGQALLESIDTNFALRWGPSTFYRGVETELAEFCVVTR